MSLIDDIYSGDVYPAEQVNPVSDAFREHSRKAEDLYGKLKTVLTEEQRGALDGGGITDTIARHVAQTLDDHADGVGSNGHSTQWSHNHGAHNLCATKDNVLHRHRQTNFEATPNK